MVKVYRIIIVVDHREPQYMIDYLVYWANTIQRFKTKHAIFKFIIQRDTLPRGQGDYIVKGKNIAFERKTYKDFMASIKDSGKIYEQIGAMCNDYDNPFLVVSGNGEFMEESELKSITTTCADFYGRYEKLKIMFCIDDEYLAYYILMQIYKIYLDLRPIDKTTPKRKPKMGNEQEYVIRAVTGFGKEKAIDLLTTFKNPKNVINASVHKLMTIHGIGEGNAQHFWDVMNKEYEPENKQKDKISETQKKKLQRLAAVNKPRPRGRK